MLGFDKAGGKFTPLLSGDGAFLSANSSGGIVLDLLSFMAQANTQQAFADVGLIPANPNVQISDPLLAGLKKQAQTASYLPGSPASPEILTAGDEMIAKVLGGERSPAEAITEACAAINAALRK